MQDLSKIAPPGDDLMAFIQNNTGGTYSWNTGAWQVSNIPAGVGADGTRYGLFSANGQTFRLPLADCPAGGCQTGSSIAWGSTSLEDQFALQAYAIASGVSMTSFVSRGAGVIGSTATAAAAVPGPHQPVAAGVGGIAGTVGLAADTVENYITGKYMVETAFYIIVQSSADKAIPMVAPITNEVIEAWKASGTRQELGVWVDQRWQEFKAKGGQK